ncbi:hypothetical protein KR222_011285 [Zaprionus bogoriensis]|nr:hypothetical protein KR222_011285 [Zaprionus bogoriensis]
MLAHKYQLSARPPLVHERIALQCARNISKSAAALPKPRTRTGHLPVLVELRCPEEDMIYRYQVNLPASCVDRDSQQMDLNEAKALSQQLNLPCLVHGRMQDSGSGNCATTAATTTAGTSQALPSGGCDLEVPQLVMMQEAVHVVHARPKPGSPSILKEAISSFHNSAFACNASKITRDHFMATLHEQEASPLDFTVLWADQSGEQVAEQELQQQQQQTQPQPQLQPQPVVVNARRTTGQFESEKKTQLVQPRNGFKLQSSRKNNYIQHQQQQQHLQLQQQQQLQQQPLLPQQQQQSEQQCAPLAKIEPAQLKLLNGYRPPRKPSRMNNSSINSSNNNGGDNNNNKVMYQSKPMTAPNYRLPLAPSAIASGPSGAPGPGSGAYKQHHLNHERVAYCDPRVYGAVRRPPPPSDHREHRPQAAAPNVPNANQFQPNRLEELHPIYAHLPRVQDYGNALDLQRELQLRQKQELELENQKLFEQQKYQRMFTDSLLASQVPPELQSMFHWDCCQLCHTVMRTMRNALDHYLSRTHLRRVDAWLIRYSFVKGNLSEDMLRHLRSSGPAVLHCDLCDLKLTSVIHARQHFYGRRHRLVERHISKPNGEGYYDKSGRWVRTNNKWLMCKLCDVIVTSESQLALHTAGVRHRKRERSTGAASVAEPYDGSHVYRINANGSLAPLNPLGGYYMYAAGCSGKQQQQQQQQQQQDVRKLNDLNAAYYCEVCNITVNHLKSVKQHEEGRMHRKRLERVTLAEYV